MDQQDGSRSEPEWLRRFDELAELAPGERSERLAALAAEQPELADRLERLFAAEEGASRFLSGSIVQRAPELVEAALEATPELSREELAPGTEIGPYRLLSLLGRGGMGEVHLAERADGEFEQRVALKLVKRGMDSEEIVRRFRRERQILARLEHPGIARILDGGTAPDGRPYFVLELVEGEPILAHCRRAGASLEERLRLVIGACEAVDAAHRNLVVHRDLKPSNLLVGADGQVKLLDFGIAKLLAEETGDMATQHEHRVLTPAYAAPEQILGEPVTTATDVYALGVILYELLTGRSPHPGHRSLSTAAEAERHETLERPSAVLRRATPEADAEGTGIPERRFARRLRGDLDTVVLKALRRDPERRYRSAADFAADLRRFLEGRPVQARPDSALYRARKLVLRHKLATAAIAVAIASLVAGLAFSLREAEIARAQAQRAERVKELLISIFREADPETSQNLTAREIFTAGAQRVETELDPEPEVQAELLDAIAQIQRSLGLFDPALATAEASLTGRRKHFGQDSAEAALSLTTLTEVLAISGNLDEALRRAEQARPAIERLFAPESPERQRLTRIRAYLLHQKGKPEEALPLMTEVTEAIRRRSGPGSLETARQLVETASILADLSRFDEAVRSTREGLAILEASPAASRVEVAKARRVLADLLQITGRSKEAAEQFAAALDLLRAALGPEHFQVAYTLVQYGFVLSEQRRYPEAEQTLREAIRILEPLDHYDVDTARRYLGFCLMAQARYAEAEQEFVAAEQSLRKKVGEEHPLVWAARVSEGWAQLKLGRLDEAERTISQVVAFYERTEPEGNVIRTALKYLGEVARLQGRIDTALALHRRAREIELKLFGTTEHPGVAASSHQIALDLLALATPEALAEARQKIDEAVAFIRQNDAGNPRLGEFLLASGQIALAAGDRERARSDLTEAASHLRDSRGKDHPQTREAEALLRRVAP